MFNREFYIIEFGSSNCMLMLLYMKVLTDRILELNATMNLCARKIVLIGWQKLVGVIGLNDTK